MPTLQGARQPAYLFRLFLRLHIFQSPWEIISDFILSLIQIPGMIYSVFWENQEFFYRQLAGD